ncbi:hypothetical protein ACL9RL_01035 [Plantibacter sp. Mn2098]|uniref:hypothetical protein n=1 Tax=Plantibacter sp. Mn2098 TaxID=3395266 RepID=UPI003BC7AFE7
MLGSGEVVGVWWWRRQKRAAESRAAATDDPYIAYQRWVDDGRPPRDDSPWPWDLGHSSPATPDEDERPERPDLPEHPEHPE